LPFSFLPADSLPSGRGRHGLAKNHATRRFRRIAIGAYLVGIGLSDRCSADDNLHSIS
jgi:hypothetical protein